MGRTVRQDNNVTVTTDTTANFSKTSKFTSSIQECFRKIKGFRRPAECTTTRPFHHFRRWKNPKHTYRFIESLPQEAIVIPDKRREKEIEYENDLQRMISLRKLKHRDPEQYKMGCMVLKWYFEGKTRDNYKKNEINRNEDGEQQRIVPHNSLDLFKSEEDLKLFRPVVGYNNGPNGKDINFRPIAPHCYYNLQEQMKPEPDNEKHTANKRILDDLVHRIDDYLGDNNTTDLPD